MKLLRARRERKQAAAFTAAMVKLQAEARLAATETHRLHRAMADLTAVMEGS